MHLIGQKTFTLFPKISFKLSISWKFSFILL